MVQIKLGVDISTKAIVLLTEYPRYLQESNSDF